MSKKIAFQGEPGANSDEACRTHFPDYAPLACPTFEEAFEAIKSGEAELGMIPVENSIAGRVADVHHLLPSSGLSIVGERFKPIRFHLMANKGVKLGDVKTVASMPIALAQCRKALKKLGVALESAGDTAGAAKALSEHPDPAKGAVAPRLAAELYGLDILMQDIEDEKHNTTRFLVMAREPVDPPANLPAITSFVFRVRNIPAALYKALGGFATNGVNMTKLESYTENGVFAATMFYVEVDGRPDDIPLARAFEELKFYSDHFAVLGTYAADPFRTQRYA
ncbi:MAG: prephenate dehydratase [Alphaproteobacteria bacterium]|nr:prephenate dehydratase [Alphaproteobacteria bacterium]